jgi:predicted LPLAT superfamily acyltransferase
MKFNPCIIIPNYNHKDTISSVVASLKCIGLTCIIIDDGSDQQTKKILKNIEQQYKWVSVITRSENGGKGAAVQAGFQEAINYKFSHAVQLDADGQHNAEDVSAFIEAAKKNPDSVIIGKPVFDQNVPKSRLYGRKITQFWVWLETLSFDIYDTLCGFRCYPLNAVAYVLKKNKLGLRMDFDLEIMVRLYWNQIPVINLPTKVNYFDENISHFNLVKDNLLISWLHTRLVVGMILRLPLLLFYKCKPKKKDENWFSLQERGALWGIQFTLLFYQIFGKPLSKVLIFFIVGYFYLTDTKARNASKDFLNRVYQTPGGKKILSHKPGWKENFKHFYEFGNIILDRISFWQGKSHKYKIDFDGYEHFNDLVNKKQGAVIISAHFGSVDVIRALASESDQIKLNILMFAKNSKNITRIFNKINPRSKLKIFDLGAITAQTAIELKECVDAGEYIGLLGDRVALGTQDRISKIPFLGCKAAFPQGPVILSSLMECPVLLIFVVREKKNHYSVKVIPFSDKIDLGRINKQQQIQQYMETYAQHLEKLCCQYPYQWFNFYPYWSKNINDKGTPKDKQIKSV